MEARSIIWSDCVLLTHVLSLLHDWCASATAATNAADVLDPALTRPGRFDTKITVHLPDKRGRKEILDLYLKKIVAAPGVWQRSLPRSSGFSVDLTAVVVVAAGVVALCGGGGGAPGIDTELLAAATPGFSGADLFAMMNSAALIAANRGAICVEPNDFEEARDKIIMGAWHYRLGSLIAPLCYICVFTSN